MDSNHFNNRHEQNQHWFCNPDSITRPVVSVPMPEPLLYPSVDGFDHSVLMNMNMNNSFIDGNFYDPYLDSALMNLNPYLTHDPHEQHHNLLTNHHLAETHCSSNNLDFQSFEELFPLLDEDLNLQHEVLQQQHPNIVDVCNENNGNYSGDSSKNYSDNYKVDAEVIEIEDNADDDSYVENVDPRYVDNSDHEGTKANKKKNKGKREGKSKASLIGFEDVSKHFDVPITKAAKRLNVGLTALKKRCRELNIERWPHRKIQSLNSLIHNLQDDVGLREDVEKLKEHKKVMVEKMPDMELTLETKRLRQACFKVNYKKRKSSYMTMAAHASSSSSSASSYFSHFKQPNY